MSLMLMLATPTAEPDGTWGVFFLQKQPAAVFCFFFLI
jgi:hypothetical protein